MVREDREDLSAVNYLPVVTCGIAIKKTKVFSLTDYNSITEVDRASSFKQDYVLLFLLYFISFFCV